MTAAFYTITNSSPKLIMRIWYSRSENGTLEPSFNGGWGFCVYTSEYSKHSGKVQEEPIYDGWDDNFNIIMQYPLDYSNEELVWYSQETDEIVDLNSYGKTLMSLRKGEHGT